MVVLCLQRAYCLCLYYCFIGLMILVGAKQKLSLSSIIDSQITLKCKFIWKLYNLICTVRQVSTYCGTSRFFFRFSILPPLCKLWNSTDMACHAWDGNVYDIRVENLVLKYFGLYLRLIGTVIAFVTF